MSAAVKPVSRSAPAAAVPFCAHCQKELVARLEKLLLPVLEEMRKTGHRHLTVQVNRHAAGAQPGDTTMRLT